VFSRIRERLQKRKSAGPPMADRSLQEQKSTQGTSMGPRFTQSDQPISGEIRIALIVGLSRSESLETIANGRDPLEHYRWLSTDHGATERLRPLR